MSTTNARQLPKAQESLADYVNRQREALGLTRIALAERAGIHKQSLGKIERGQTQTLNRRTLNSLSKALEVPTDYLDAVVRGQAGELGPSLKFCPQCWQTGTAPDPIWTDARSQFCFMCGTGLQDSCGTCGEPLHSLTFRFCPHCGQPYKPASRSSAT